ncbi:MAG TPA: CDP-alcohol phosphatidyltransferase family protein, partial [Solirubrobacterales bacterium]|nr:CDP-alcohol phosphatidyltransferase family protein [Solirubrobacterales bacterium]
MRTALTVPLTVLVAQVLLFAGLALTAGLDGSGLGPAGWTFGLVCGGAMSLALARGCSYWGIDRLGPADWVTLVRATLAVGVAALVADSFAASVPVALLVTLAALALVLDAADGWIARRTGTTSALGERMDGEVDAFLILVLSVYVARSAGAWVLAIGAARYAFLAAGYALPWLRAPLPERYWRKVVCATQGIVLTVAAAGVLPSAVEDAALGVALVLLAESFGRDVWWSWSHRDREAADAETAAGPALLDEQSSDAPPPDSGPEPEDGPPAERGPWRGRIRAVIAAVLTALSFLLVWAVLVAPDQPVFLKAGAFLRVPLEGLVVVAIAIFLPVTGRRILAVLTGLALALVVVLKVINYEIFSLFSRAFEPLGDIGQFGNAIETLHLEQGDSQARLIEIGAVAGVVAAVVLLPLAMLRVTRVAADHRQRALRVIGALAGVWLVLGVLGTTLVSRTPIASTISAGVIFDTAKVVRAEVHDEGVFAKEIKHDAFRDTPTNQLLTALRGKDVLLVFAESFGRVAIEESSIAPEVNEALAEGDKRLASAG